mmetsp:Transcript_22383/g.64219  ORF Transcript_22383/g.64219 Transcript_22383/m.64219 type:complete len:326 (+) Transcript_22383:792-1769(+)
MRVILTPSSTSFAGGSTMRLAAVPVAAADRKLLMSKAFVSAGFHTTSGNPGVLLPPTSGKLRATFSVHTSPNFTPVTPDQTWRAPGLTNNIDASMCFQLKDGDKIMLLGGSSTPTSTIDRVLRFHTLGLPDLSVRAPSIMGSFCAEDACPTKSCPATSSVSTSPTSTADRTFRRRGRLPRGLTSLPLPTVKSLASKSMALSVIVFIAAQRSHIFCNFSSSLMAVFALVIALSPSSSRHTPRTLITFGSDVGSIAQKSAIATRNSSAGSTVYSTKYFAISTSNLVASEGSCMVSGSQKPVANVRTSAAGKSGGCRCRSRPFASKGT